jgi:hypothetical protein
MHASRGLPDCTTMATHEMTCLPPNMICHGAKLGGHICFNNKPGGGGSHYLAFQLIHTSIRNTLTLASIDRRV